MRVSRDFRSGNKNRNNYSGGPFRGYTLSYAESPRSRFAMSLTDLNGPWSFQPRHAGLRRTLPPASLPVSLALFLCCATFGASVSRAQEQPAQSVAEAARQARARKQAQQNRTEHVYTNDDLSRAHILTPEDRAQVEARKNECTQKNNCLPAPSQKPPATLDANFGSHGISLGEVARRYRKQKELQALKPKQTTPFHLPVPAAVFAAPVLPERPAIRPPVSQPRGQKMSPNVFRRDPFSAVPIPPNISSRTKLPAGAPEDPRPSRGSGIHSGVYESVRPASHSRPNVAVREDLRLVVHPNVSAGAHNEVRLTDRSHARMPALQKPKIPSLPEPSRVSPRISQPAAPANSALGNSLAESVRPLMPIETVRAPRPLRSVPAVAISPSRILAVQWGDSLWSLALQNLGRGSRWPELLAANPWIANPNQIRAGARLALPIAARNVTTPRMPPNHFATSAGQSSASTIRLHKGDTLWGIARSHYGRGTLWPCIAGANPSIGDPNSVLQGQQLVLPSSCAP